MPGRHSYGFGEYVLDLQRGALLRAGASVKLRPKSFEVLRVLIERHGQLVTKEELLDAVWGNVVVTEGSLTQCLVDIRRALGDVSQEVIRTVPRRGYIFDVSVVALADASGTGGVDARPPASPDPTHRVPGRRAIVVLAVLTVLAALATWWAQTKGGGDTSAPTRPGEAQAGLNSVAVLPFVDMSAGHDQRYLADGIAEEILNRLAQSGELRVIARTSSFSFRDQPLHIPGIAAALNVSHVLEGSVRRSGNRVRITAQLIEASSNSHVWSDSYERRLDDLFAVQDEIATAVASALNVALVRGVQGSRMPANAAAYESFLQGQFFYHRRASGDFERAVRYFERAVALDPGYARAWAALSGAYGFLVEPGRPETEVWRDRQGEAARRSVELDPGLASAHQRLAGYYGETANFELAEVHLRQARELDPDDALVLGGLVSEAISRGDFDEAIAIERRVVARDPLSPLNRNILGVLLIAAGRLDEAMSEYRKVLDLNPDAGPDIRIDIVRILVLQERYDEATAMVSQLADGKFRDFGLALLYLTPDWRAEADAALERLAARPEDVLDSVRLAEVYAFRGMTEEAFSSLHERRIALERHGAAAWGWITYFQNELRVSPFLVPLHADSRWTVLLAAPGRR